MTDRKLTWEQRYRLKRNLYGNPYMKMLMMGANCGHKTAKKGSCDAQFLRVGNANH